MTLENRIKTGIERVDQIYSSFARKMDEDIDYARVKVIEKHLVPDDIDPDHLTLGDMIDLLANR